LAWIKDVKISFNSFNILYIFYLDSIARYGNGICGLEILAFPSFNNDMKAMVTYDRNLKEFFRSKFIFFQAHLNLKAVVDKK